MGGKTTTTTGATTKMTINAHAKQIQSQIPSYHGGGVNLGLEHYQQRRQYQQQQQQQQQQRSNSFKHQHQHQHHHQHQHQHHHQSRQQQQPSQLPQILNQCITNSNTNSNTTPIATTKTTTTTITTTETTASTISSITRNNYQGSTIECEGFGQVVINNSRLNAGNGAASAGANVGSGNYNTGSGSSSATSSSPLSPPSVTYNRDKDDSKLVNEMNKLYRKSPFMQKKYNGSSFNRHNSSPGDESPKKESVLSTIGQSILRNLTTSPFSQKKNNPNIQTNQIDALWRTPITQDASITFDTCDVSTSHAIDLKNASSSESPSPALQRKKFHVGNNDSKPIKKTISKKPSSLDEEKQEIKPSLIPLTKSEAQPQYVPGNHSPIVLQRFYHQQHQLREKELERQNHYPNIYSKYSPSEGTSLLQANFQQAPSSPQLQLQQQHNSHIPIASTSTLSSYSTSSQSSTQSSQCSQIGVGVGGGGGDVGSPTTTTQGPKSLPLLLNDTKSSSTTSPATLGFGTRTTSPTLHLQYQPLPQQYLNNSAATTTSYGGSIMRNSRSPATSPETLSDSAVLGKQHNPRITNATSPTITKLSKLYNQRSGSASASLTNASTASSKENNFKSDSGATSPTPNGQATERKNLLYYRAMSCGSSSSSNSQATSPSTETCKAVGSEGFREGSSAAGFIRRYAATGGAGSNVNASGPSTSLPAAHTPAHILANLDRRHRSPDPPPRYNRGQSPLLLRKNILELSGQPPGTSPMFNRRFVNASPPLPPPRRGSESVPGSPQHFRTRIHYTPEPQRRIYRTIDQ